MCDAHALSTIGQTSLASILNHIALSWIGSIPLLVGDMERVPYGAHKRRAFSMDNDWHGSERLSDSIWAKAIAIYSDLDESF